MTERAASSSAFRTHIPAVHAKVALRPGVADYGHLNVPAKTQIYKPELRA